jgi:RHS repeat-associated protein
MVDGKRMSANYSYTDDMLTEIETPSSTYNIGYGSFALRTSISVGGNPLATYDYTDSEKRYLETLDYGNNDKVQYTYDNLGRVVQEVYTEENGTVFRTVTYTYTANGALATTNDSKTSQTTKYYYDNIGRSTGWMKTGGNIDHTLRYTYDTDGTLKSSTELVDNILWTTDYAYDNYNRLTCIAQGQATKYYNYDNFNRITSTTTIHQGTPLHSRSITYDTNSDRITSLGLGIAGTYQYTYDANGNIIAISKGGKTTSYVYDSANQLIRENNEEAGKTWVWTYDEAGNITSKKEYAYTTGTLGTATDTITYSYGNSEWGDLLTAYDGTSISYDAIGNPTHDANWSYTWSQGRQLSSMYRASVTWNFTYDANGMRTGRSYGSTAYTYVYSGSQLSYMTCGNNTMKFTYGADGSPLAISYNGTIYFYVVNLQGDVVAILNSNGTQVVTYTYDAWGRLLDMTDTSGKNLGLHNPLRYRGYVYDQETGLYYLNSRYYNPQWGRFLNADAFAATGQGLLGNNMFVYCRNNPVCRVDITGMMDMSCLDDEHDKDLFPDDDFGYVDNTFANNGGNVNIVLYRATSLAEYNSVMQSGQFSQGGNSVDGKYFATTYSHAEAWGNRMYLDGNFKIIKATFDRQILRSTGTQCWKNLDSIGEAYFFEIDQANRYMVALE